MYYKQFRHFIYSLITIKCGLNLAVYTSAPSKQSSTLLSCRPKLFSAQVQHFLKLQRLFLWISLDRARVLKSDKVGDPRTPGERLECGWRQVYVRAAVILLFHIKAAPAANPRPARYIQRQGGKISARSRDFTPPTQSRL